MPPRSRAVPRQRVLVVNDDGIDAPGLRAVVVALAAQIRYSRYSKRVLKRQQRWKRADKLLDALAGTLRAIANPDATPATSLAPETDTLVRENT